MAKVVKRSLAVIGCILLACLLTVGGYLAYAYIQYHRLPDNLTLSVSRPSEPAEAAAGPLHTKTSLRIATFNIGYGSYPADYTFFMDGGKEVRARSVQAVHAAVAEDLRLLKDQKPDFINIQEIDWDGDRSQHVDEPAAFRHGLGSYYNVLSQNYDSAYLFYPVTDPIGAAKSGIMTLSRYPISRSTRYSLPIETNFNKFFDLDRCFSVSLFKVAGGKNLYLYNVHLSAYTHDQAVQTAQLKTLFTSMAKHVQAGDYVICGGDYNHVLTGQAHPELTWMHALPIDDLPQGLRVEAPKNGPSVRTLDKPYNPATSVTGDIDGFLVSDNIESLSVNAVQNGFKSSDHNPVVMDFILK